MMQNEAKNLAELIAIHRSKEVCLFDLRNLGSALFKIFVSKDISFMHPLQQASSLLLEHQDRLRRLTK